MKEIQLTVGVAFIVFQPQEQDLGSYVQQEGEKLLFKHFFVFSQNYCVGGISLILYWLALMAVDNLECISKWHCRLFE